jgi:hypothetical protein
MKRLATSTALTMLILWCQAAPAAMATEAVDATSLSGKVMCGYQGWFRCPADAANLGWVHWSRNLHRILPATLTFELWPDMSDYGADERFPAPGFTYPDGQGAQLFSSDNAATVRRHFQWMREYGIDGAWLQRFCVGLPDPASGKQPRLYSSALRVMGHARTAAEETGRAWALSYDTAGMKEDRIFDVLTADWKRIVDDRLIDTPRYLRQGGRPVVQIWGFYWNSPHDPMSAGLANRLIDFFHAPGRYAAYLVGGGSWNWRKVSDPDWKKFCLRFDAYAPWNVGNFGKDAQGIRHAATGSWAEDQRECRRHGVLWMPVVYPGFSWDNLKQSPPGESEIPRRGGRFLWEQFHALSKLGADTVYVAMFDEVDEGTAIFKVTSSPPRQAHFVGYEGFPSDWYLRLVGQGTRMLREKTPIPAEIPLRP